MLVKLKGKRVEKGYNQTDMAKLLNMATSTYNLKENGIREFTARECIEIMNILECSFEDIFLQ